MRRSLRKLTFFCLMRRLDSYFLIHYAYSFSYSSTYTYSGVSCFHSPKSTLLQASIIVHRFNSFTHFLEWFWCYKSNIDCKLSDSLSSFASKILRSLLKSQLLLLQYLLSSLGSMTTASPLHYSILTISFQVNQFTSINSKSLRFSIQPYNVNQLNHLLPRRLKVCWCDQFYV